VNTDGGTIAAALSAARALGLERLDAQLLLGHLLARPRTWLLAHDDASLAPQDRGAFEALVRRRAAGEPLAYLTGHCEFHGLRLQVNAGVLVPRPDTETLVDWGLELLASDGALAAAEPVQVLDLGTGSGAIALAIKRRQPAAAVVATDASDAALAVARANGRRLGLDIAWIRGDWFEAVGSSTFDLVLSNPPYVALDDPHWPGLRHEPRAALAAGALGLDDLARIVERAPAHLRPGGWLLLEHGADQGPAVRALLARRGFGAILTRRDLAGRERCTGACWGAARADRTVDP
jgi:release factor glutamine methyltransferase